MIVIDSSTLVSLTKINNLSILNNFPKLICPEEIYEETVEQGIFKGYPDAIIIKKTFDKKIISKKKIPITKVFTGVSKNDSKVLNLALKGKVKTLFIDDTKLARKAEFEGFNVKNTADLLLILVKKNKLTKNKYQKLIKELNNRNRISEKNMNIYLRLGGKK